MYLFIDNTNDEQIVLKLFLNKVWVQAIFMSSEYQLLSAIDRFLNDNNVSLKDVKGLAILMGKGRFTATRISVTIANSMALALEIPVVGVREFADDIIEKILDTSVGQLISAEYSSEANIGKKKNV